MSVRKVRIWPDPALRQKAKPIIEVDDSVKTLIGDMFETMYKANGIGLAATQLGVALRPTPRSVASSKPGASPGRWHSSIPRWFTAKVRLFGRRAVCLFRE
jgi:peptide deformylase